MTFFQFSPSSNQHKELSSSSNNLVLRMRLLGLLLKDFCNEKDDQFQLMKMMRIPLAFLKLPLVLDTQTFTSLLQIQDSGCNSFTNVQLLQIHFYLSRISRQVVVSLYLIYS